MWSLYLSQKYKFVYVLNSGSGKSPVANTFKSPNCGDTSNLVNFTYSLPSTVTISPSVLLTKLISAIWIKRSRGFSNVNLSMLKWVSSLTCCDVEISLRLDFHVVEASFTTIETFNERLWNEGLEYCANVVFGDFSPENLNPNEWVSKCINFDDHWPLVLTWSVECVSSQS